VIVGHGRRPCGFLCGYTEGSAATYCGVAGLASGVIACCILGAAKQKIARCGTQHVVLGLQKVGRERT